MNVDSVNIPYMDAMSWAFKNHHVSNWFHHEACRQSAQLLGVCQAATAAASMADAVAEDDFEARVFSERISGLQTKSYPRKAVK